MTANEGGGEDFGKDHMIFRGNGGGSVGSVR